MKKILLSSALLLTLTYSQAQNYTLNGKDYTTEISGIEVSNFDGQTLATAPTGKSKTVTLTKTSFSKPINGEYESLALPELKLGNIITHPTLGWDDTDYHIPDIVPEIYSNDWTLNDVFYDGDYPVAIYGRTPDSVKIEFGKTERQYSQRGRDPHLIMLVDPNKEIKKVYNTSSMTFPPKNRRSEYDRQSVNWAVVKDGILYFSISGLDGFDGGQNAYLVAIDTSTDKTLWVSKPNTCNSNNFIIIDNSIICGYGGSGISDYVNVLNRFTGVQKQHIWIPTAADWFAIGSDKKLYVSLYDKHISFTITR